MITTTKYENLDEVMKRIHAFKVTGVVEQTTCKESYTIGTEIKELLY